MTRYFEQLRHFSQTRPTPLSPHVAKGWRRALSIFILLLATLVSINASNCADVDGDGWSVGQGDCRDDDTSELPDQSVHSGWLIPDAPADLIAALGYGDKKIYVLPSRELVVVRHGDSAGEAKQAFSSFDTELWRRLRSWVLPSEFSR
jgi:hypothetical protein